MATEQANTIQKRRYHTRAYKAQVVAECGQEGASTAAVALAHGPWPERNHGVEVDARGWDSQGAAPGGICSRGCAGDAWSID